MTILSSYPCKVIVNPFEDRLCFAWAELIEKPSDWIAVFFGIIAAINAVTQRKDVCSDSAGTIRARQRYPMIHCQRVPQPRRSTADSTASAEIIDGALPILRVESPIKLALPGSPAVSVHSRLFRIIVRPFASFGAFVIGVLSVPLPICGFYRGRMVFRPFSRSRIVFNFCSFVVFMRSRFSRRRMFPIPFIGRGVMARSTFAAQAINRVASSEKVSRSWQIVAAAIGTALEGVGQVEHSVSLSLYHLMLSADGVICRRSGATLADDYQFYPIRKGRANVE